MVVDMAYDCSSIFPVHGQTEKAARKLPVQRRLRLTVLRSRGLASIHWKINSCEWDNEA